MIHEDTAAALYTEMTHLRRKLTEVQADKGRLLQACKDAYNGQLSERSSLSVSLLEEIRKHEPDWAPEPRAKREPWPTKGALAERHEQFDNGKAARAGR